ncbi:MAG TPA: hypothetical protein VHZ06_00205 [Marmoricola sp.]|jgi:uncharacterized protein involved in exopolysaccharide biosynthesis|nr:hypothetical protein [Marmoricola sp.]
MSQTESGVPGRARGAFGGLRSARRALGKANALPDGAADVIADLQRRLADVEREAIRLSPQVAALEARVEDLRARLDDTGYPADDAERAEARRLVEEVRSEHAKVRARISGAVVFEERLRVLEERAP